MGGRGSGEWYRYSKKNTTCGLNKVSISNLKKWGCLAMDSHKSGTIGWSWLDESRGSMSYICFVSEGEAYFRAKYIKQETQEKFDYKISLIATVPNYGGLRWWFRCINCHRRVAVLYMGANYLACRKCYNLAYDSQNEDFSNRMLRKAQKISTQLGGEGVVEWVQKPKGMHWKTYNRKMALMKEYENHSWGGLMKKLGYHGLSIEEAMG